MSAPVESPAVSIILRAEHLAIFVAGVVLWLANGGPPILLVPAWILVDASMIGYLGGPRLGSIAYNAAHNLVLPLALIGLGWSTDVGWQVLAGAVFLTHVGLDRALGYGLKLPTDFKETHLGRIGKAESPVVRPPG